MGDAGPLPEGGPLVPFPVGPSWAMPTGATPALQAAPKPRLGAAEARSARHHPSPGVSTRPGHTARAAPCGRCHLSTARNKLYLLRRF